MCSSRSPTLPSSVDSLGSANLRPTTLWSRASSSSENAGSRNPRTLPSTSQNCSEVPFFSGEANCTGRYRLSEGPR